MAESKKVMGRVIIKQEITRFHNAKWSRSWGVESSKSGLHTMLKEDCVIWKIAKNLFPE
jgi:hypothetical protein